MGVEVPQMVVQTLGEERIEGSRDVTSQGRFIDGRRGLDIFPTLQAWFVPDGGAPRTTLTLCSTPRFEKFGAPLAVIPVELQSLPY